MYTVVGIGNPLLDTTASVSEEFLVKSGLPKGTMQLIDAAKNRELLLKLPKNALRSAGGSVANTLAGVVSLGGYALFMGAVGDSEHGLLFENQVKRIGIQSALARLPEDQGTCIVFVTADGERTMATHLGASIAFRKEHIQEEVLRRTSFLHIEGFQLDSPNQTEAIEHAMQLAKASGAKVSLDVADVGLIRRHRQALERLIEKYVDVVFANETEAAELTGANPERAARELGCRCEIAVVKIGADGSLVTRNGSVHRVSPFTVDVVNTNGAGDTFAGAFLQSLAAGRDVATAGVVASFLASRVVASPYGRIEKDYRAEVEALLAAR